MILFLIILSSIQYNLVNVADYWVELDSLEEYFYDRLHLSIFYEGLEVGYYLLREIPSDASKAISASNFNIGFRTDYLEISYGRLYPVFGRGLILREYLDEDFRIDKGIGGILINAYIKDLSIQAISGHPKNLLFDGRHYYISNDTTDILRGIDINLQGKISLGARYVRLSSEEDPAPSAFSEIYGVDFGFTWDWFDTYVELVQKIAYKQYSGERIAGWGTYATASFSFEGLGCLIQYIDYDSLALGRNGVRYNEPPAINRQGISINRGDDEKGLGISLSYSPRYYLNFNGCISKSVTHKEDREVAEHFLSADYMGDVFSGVFTFDHLLLKEVEPGISRKEEYVPEVVLTFGDFELEGTEKFIKEDTQKYREIKLSLSYTYRSNLTFTVLGETRTINKYDEGKNWQLFKVSGNIGNNHNIILSYGSQKGGLTCSGGICRYQEPFEGFKVSLLTRL